MRRCKEQIIIMTYVFLVMFFCIGTSPFINHLPVDSSVFFLMGRAMASGKVVYLDLFDHKGWYTFFFNGVGAAIGNGHPWGVYIVEAIIACIGVLSVYYIGKRIFKSGWYGALTAMAMLCLSLNYFSHRAGNFNENYGLAFQFVSLYLLFRYYGEGKIEHNQHYMFVHGLCVGIMFGLKANMIFMWIPIAVFIIGKLLLHKKYGNAIKNIIFGLAGVAVAFVPMILYGVTQNCMEDMIYQMVLFNLSYTSQNTSFIQNFVSFFTNKDQLLIILGLLFSFVIVLFDKKMKTEEKVLYFFMWIFSAISSCAAGKRYGHYYEYLIPFILPGVIFLIGQIRRFEDFFVFKKKWLMVLLIFFATLCLNLRTPIKLFMTMTSEGYKEAANICAEIKKEYYPESNKVVVTGNNAHFYNAMDVIPEIKYFYLPAITYERFPDAIDAQAESIINAESDVAIVFYNDFEQRYVFENGVHNEDVMLSLQNHYDLLYRNEEWGMEMYGKHIGEL